VKLPRGDEAIIPAGKIETYCLNGDHEDGGPKSRVFAAALGLTSRHTDFLRAALLDAARTQDAVAVLQDRHGTRYRIDFALTHAGRTRTVRSGWIIHDPGERPYLTTAFVLPSSHG
jgi:hypothetical protein